MNDRMIMFAWAIFAAPLAILNEALEAGREGGTLGGQALLFLAVISLAWAGYKLYKYQQAATEQLVKSVVLTATEQRDEDRAHHKELVTTFRDERAVNILEKNQNFQILLSIAKESAAALTMSSKASERTAAVAEATANAIRDVSNVLRDMKHEAHKDATTVTEAKIVNKPTDPVIAKIL